MSLNTLTDGTFDQIIVGGAVTVSGTLALGQQTTMPGGTVVLIDGGSLSGSFASTTGLINALLIGQEITYDSLTGEVRLVTTTLTPEPDPAFPTGCVVTPSTPLADGGTLSCVSETPFTETIATSVDGVRIVIGNSSTPTTVMSASGDALTASIAGTSSAENISINTEFGILSGAANGIVATTAGSGSITITGGSVTGNAGSGISATSTGGDISISGAHTVLGTGGRGIYADSDGGDISIQGVGTTGGVTGSAGDGISADARGGTGGNINIGDTSAIGDVSGSGSGNSGITANTDGVGRSITIDASGGTVMRDGTGSTTALAAFNAGTGASSVSVTSADVTSSGSGIYAGISNSAATGDIIVDSTAGTVMASSFGILARNYGSGTTHITTASVSVSDGTGILISTVTGATIIVTAGSTVSGGGGEAAIRTSAPGGVSATPADSLDIRGTVSGGGIETLGGADSVTLAAESTTTGITIDLGEGDDTLDLASVNFGTFDGGADSDTLSVSGTGITLEGSAHSNFETLAFTAGSNTVSGNHTIPTASVATGATLDLASGSSLSGDLSNSGMLTIAGSGFGSATISGGLTLSAGGTLTLDTNGAGGETDLLTVSGALTLDGTLALRQATMPNGTVVLIDGGSLSGTFASTSGLVNAPLLSQRIVYDSLTGEVRLVTSVMVPDSNFPTGCTVSPSSPLADGGTLTCISETPITESAHYRPSMESLSSSAIVRLPQPSCPPRATLSTRLSASTSDTRSITINTEFGIISERIKRHLCAQWRNRRYQHHYRRGYYLWHG